MTVSPALINSSLPPAGAQPPFGMASPPAVTPTEQAVSVWTQPDTSGAQQSMVLPATAGTPAVDALAGASKPVALAGPAAAATTGQLALGAPAFTQGTPTQQGTGKGHGRRRRRRRHGHDKAHGNNASGGSPKQHDGAGKADSPKQHDGSGRIASPKQHGAAQVGLPFVGQSGDDDLDVNGPAKAAKAGMGKGIVLPPAGFEGAAQGKAGVAQMKLHDAGDAGPAKAHGNGKDAAGGSSVGGFLSGLLSKIDISRVLLFAGLGAAATMVIPPLAPLGAIGGALAGAALSLLW